MAKNTPTATAETRSASVMVGPDRAQALAAAYDGVYHIFGGRVENWTTTEDGLFANGFSVDGKYDPEAILTALAAHVRRAPLMPTLGWINGIEPEDFANSQAVTTFTVQYFKGIDGEEGGSKVPEWVRKAAQDYKNGREGFYQKRGPKAKTIQLKNLSEVNPEVLLTAGIQVSDLEHLIEVATSALASRKASDAVEVAVSA
jgi:hypothetical protein